MPDYITFENWPENYDSIKIVKMKSEITSLKLKVFKLKKFLRKVRRCQRQQRKSLEKQG